MNTFTKWFLLNAVMVTAIFFAETKGAISAIIQNDLSHISILIMFDPKIATKMIQNPPKDGPEEVRFSSSIFVLILIHF